MSKVAQSTLTEFGEAVHRARALKGWQLKDLSNEMAGSSGVSFLSDIEKGKRSISTPTVGRLIAALGLDETWMDRFMGTDTAEDEITETDLRAEAMMNAAEKDGVSGVGEALLIGLARDFAEGDTPDLDTAYRGLRAALETAREMKERAALPDNTDAGISAVRAEVQRLNEGDKREAAREAIVEAMAKKTAEMSALLDLGVQQDRILNDPAAAADKLVEQARLGGEGSFDELRALRRAWYERGRDGGLAFEATVAIHLAQASLAQGKTADKRGAALNDLGIALCTLGERESGTARLEEAVAAFRAALEENTRERVPLDWAMTQNNLGNALRTLGERESGTARLEEAVAAYRAALEERTRDRVPLDWAMTQNNLGNALKVLGEREGGTARLEEAVTAFRAALEERNRDRVPLQWALTQNNFGAALSTLGARESSTARLEQAVSAYRAALEENTRERVPLNWAMTQENMALVYLSLFEKTQSADQLSQAKTHATQALGVYRDAHAGFYIEKTERLLKQIDGLK